MDLWKRKQQQQQLLDKFFSPRTLFSFLQRLWVMQ